MEANKITTKRLFRILRDAPHTLKDMVFDERNALIKLLRSSMNKSDISPLELAARVGLSESFVYQILNGSRTPGRDVAIRIALALNMNLDDTQKLLNRAAKAALYPKNRRDAFIISAIERHLTIEEINTGLSENALEMLLKK